MSTFAHAHIIPSTVVDCGPPSSPGPTGTVSVSMTTFGNVATYSCDLGHELHPDNSIRICQANGMWSGIDPFCQGMKYVQYTVPTIKLMLDCTLKFPSEYIC